MSDRFQTDGVEHLPELDISDVHKIDAAEGHHMIGLYQEAADEIASIPPERRDHPRALHVACRAYWALRQLPEAISCTERFMRAAPGHPFGYVFMSMLLSYVHKPKECYDLLRGAAPRFPEHATIHFDLAHAAAQCELWSEARQWLYHAICIQPPLKQVALDTPAFAAIWAEIEGMNPRN